MPIRHRFQAAASESVAADLDAQSRLTDLVHRRTHFCAYRSIDRMGKWESHDHRAGLHRLR